MSASQKRNEFCIYLCFSKREWNYLDKLIGSRKRSSFIVNELHKFVNNPSSVDLEFNTSAKKFSIYDADLETAIKKRAKELKIRPSKLISRIIMDRLQNHQL